MELYNNALRIARVKFHNRSSKSSIHSLIKNPILNDDRPDFQRLSQFHHLFEELTFHDYRSIFRNNKPFTHAKLFSNNSTLLMDIQNTSFYETVSELEYARDEVVCETEGDTPVYDYRQLYEMDIMNYLRRLQLCRGVINGKK